MSTASPQTIRHATLDATLYGDLDGQLSALESAPSSALYNGLLGRFTTLNSTYGQDRVFHLLLERLTAARAQIEVQAPTAGQTPSLAGKAVQPIAMTFEDVCQRLGSLNDRRGDLLTNNIAALRVEYEALVRGFNSLPDNIKNGNDPFVPGVKIALREIHRILTAPKPFFSPSFANKLVTVLNMAANYYHEHAFLPAMVWGVGIQLAMDKAQAEPITSHTVLKGAFKGTGVAFVNRYLDGAAFSFKSAIAAGVLGAAKDSHPAVADASQTLNTMMTVETTAKLGHDLWTDPVGTIWYMVKVVAVVTGGVIAAARMGIQLPQNQNP